MKTSMIVIGTILASIARSSEVQAVIFDPEDAPYNAAADCTTDDLPAFNAVLAAMADDDVIELRPGACFYLGGTLSLTKRAVVRCAVDAPQISVPTCQLKFAASAHGIKTTKKLTVDQVYIKSNGGSGAYHGIWPDGGSIRLDNVFVDGFPGNGVHIDCDVNRTPATNCNHWVINYGRMISNGGHGIYTNAGDANAGVAIGTDVTGNGGWGVLDSAFLQNTYVGMHASLNSSGSYRADGSNARTSFINCYQEGNQPSAYVVAPAMWIGGNGTVAGSGTDFRGGSGKTIFARNPVEFTNDTQSGNRVRFQAAPYSDGAAFSFFGEDRFTSDIYRLTLKTAGSYTDWWALQSQNLNTQTALAIAGDFDAQTYPVWLPGGAWVGSSATRAGLNGVQRGSTFGIEIRLNGTNRFLGWAGAAPTTGTFATGDIVFSTVPGATAGWRCTAGGSPGTWTAWQ